MKTCTKCGVEKPTDSFYRSSQCSDGFHPWCKPCKKEWHRKDYHDNQEKMLARRAAYALSHPREVQDTKLRGTYGITVEQYEQMVVDHNGQCAICGTYEPGGRGRLHIDHDHTCCVGKKSCGKCIRGLLCSKCNSVLGYFNDDINRLQSAIDYLAKWGNPNV